MNPLCHHHSTPELARDDREGTTPHPQSAHWPPAPPTEAEIVAGHRRYLRRIGFRGILPDRPSYGDFLLDSLNREGE